jgi:hypothetical protein
MDNRSLTIGAILRVRPNSIDRMETQAIGELMIDRQMIAGSSKLLGRPQMFTGQSDIGAIAKIR